MRPWPRLITLRLRPRNSCEAELKNYKAKVEAKVEASLCAMQKTTNKKTMLNSSYLTGNLFT